jgi:hypothetical protein
VSHQPIFHLKNSPSGACLNTPHYRTSLLTCMVAGSISEIMTIASQGTYFLQEINILCNTSLCNMTMIYSRCGRMTRSFETWGYNSGDYEYYCLLEQNASLTAPVLFLLPLYLYHTFCFIFYPEDGSSRFLQNIDTCLPTYTALQSKKPVLFNKITYYTGSKAILFGDTHLFTKCFFSLSNICLTFKHITDTA